MISESAYAREYNRKRNGESERRVPYLHDVLYNDSYMSNDFWLKVIVNKLEWEFQV